MNISKKQAKNEHLFSLPNEDPKLIYLQEFSKKGYFWVVFYNSSEEIIYFGPFTDLQLAIESAKSFNLPYVIFHLKETSGEKLHDAKKLICDWIVKNCSILQ